jgi:hypothetical protein
MGSIGAKYGICTPDHSPIMWAKYGLNMGSIRAKYGLNVA